MWERSSAFLFDPPRWAVRAWFLSEFVFVATGHLARFTTSIREAVEFHPPVAHW